MVLPIATVTSAFVNMLLTSIITFGFLILSGRGFSVGALLYLPLIAVIEYIFALGMCMLFSALTVFFRDLEYLLGVITMAWLYLTPIMYTLEMVPESLRGIFRLNPMTPIITAYQDILYFKRVPMLHTFYSAGLVGIVFLFAGYFAFERLQKKFVEEL